MASFMQVLARTRTTAEPTTTDLHLLQFGQEDLPAGTAGYGSGSLSPSSVVDDEKFFIMNLAPVDSSCIASTAGRHQISGVVIESISIEVISTQWISITSSTPSDCFPAPVAGMRPWSDFLHQNNPMNGDSSSVDLPEAVGLHNHDGNLA
jgi:hypothetical protein